MSDISQVFESVEMLRGYQAIKGFDKSDFCEVLNSICNFLILRKPQYIGFSIIFLNQYYLLEATLFIRY